PDPLGVEAGWHPYAYPTDPLSFTDPMGLDPQYRIPKMPNRGESEYVLLSKDPALTQLTPRNRFTADPNINELGASSKVCKASGHDNIPERLSPAGTRQFANKGRLVIESHGVPGKLELDGAYISGKDLATLLKKRGFKGDQIVLVVCHAGTPSATGKSVAQDLADELWKQTGRPVEVVAAKGAVINYPDGTLSAGYFRPGSTSKKLRDWNEGVHGTSFMSFAEGRPPKEMPPPRTRRP